MYARTIDVELVSEINRGLHQGYRYLLKDHIGAYMAFQNKEDLEYFLDATTLQIIPSQKGYVQDNFPPLELSRPVADMLFSFITDIPHIEKATIFSEVSNGQYVKCYTYIEDGVCLIFRPNPNYEDVYIPRTKNHTIERPILKAPSFESQMITIRLKKGIMPEQIHFTIKFEEDPNETE